MAIKITPSQSGRINSLIQKLCCNYDLGNCLLLDDGEACVCIQSISRYGIYCNYFKNSVLPADKTLYVEVMKRTDKKHCVVCGAAFVPGSNRQKYCGRCKVLQERRKDTERKHRKRYG